MAIVPDPWTALRQHTAARIALGRAGNSLPTAEWLRFAQAHALARDAVHQAFDGAGVAAQLRQLAFDTLQLESAAADRATYLRRPDLGRRLSELSAQLLRSLPEQQVDLDVAAVVAVVVGDGLSARAAQMHAVPLLAELRACLEAQGKNLILGPVAVVTQCRVALGDEVGVLLQARAVLVLIGERPGLSSPDSLGAYLSWQPRPGLSDAQRNCVSNIRPEGQPVAVAARRIAWLLVAAARLGCTGVALKDESDAAALAGAASPALLPALRPAL